MSLPLNFADFTLSRPSPITTASSAPTRIRAFALSSGGFSSQPAAAAGIEVIIGRSPFSFCKAICLWALSSGLRSRHRLASETILRSGENDLSQSGPGEKSKRERQFCVHLILSSLNLIAASVTGPGMPSATIPAAC